MITHILTFIEERKAAAEKRNFERGYDWAAGMLLRGATEEEIQTLIECSEVFDSYNGFDEGAEQAIKDFDKRLKLV